MEYRVEYNAQFFDLTDQISDATQEVKVKYEERIDQLKNPTTSIHLILLDRLAFEYEALRRNKVKVFNITLLNITVLSK